MYVVCEQSSPQHGWVSAFLHFDGFGQVPGLQGLLRNHLGCIISPCVFASVPVLGMWQPGSSSAAVFASRIRTVLVLGLRVLMVMASKKIDVCLVAFLLVEVEQ